MTEPNNSKPITDDLTASLDDFSFSPEDFDFSFSPNDFDFSLTDDDARSTNCIHKASGNNAKHAIKKAHHKAHQTHPQS